MKCAVSVVLSIIMLLSVIALSACGKDEVTGVSMAVQDYSGSNIYELPRFEGRGKAVEQLNNAIQEQLGAYISGWESVRNDDTSWYELRSYPICGQRYKQVVVTAIQFPNYGTDGDVYSFCYDTETGSMLTLDEAFAQAGVSRETVETRIEQLINDHLYEGDVVIYTSCVAFAFAGGELYVIARAIMENELADGHDDLFLYNTAQDAMTAYSFGNLFPAGLCDQLEPALAYSQQ